MKQKKALTAAECHPVANMVRDVIACDDRIERCANEIEAIKEQAGLKIKEASDALNRARDERLKFLVALNRTLIASGKCSVACMQGGAVYVLSASPAGAASPASLDQLEVFQ